MGKTVVPMTEGEIWKRITYFALPLMLGNLFQQMYNTADSLIVGNFLGSNALAAVSSSSSLIFMLIGLFSGLASGAGVIISRYFGAKNTELLQKAVHTAAAFGLIAGVLLTAAGVALTPQILIWMSTPPAVMTESISYLQVYFAGSIGFVMYNVFVGILQAVGDSRHPLYYLIASSLINIVLDIVFIRYFNSGVAGAALATIISQFISALLCFIQITRTTDIYRLQIKDVRIDRAILLQIFHLGLPPESRIPSSPLPMWSYSPISIPSAKWPWPASARTPKSKASAFFLLPASPWRSPTFVSQNLARVNMTV